MKFIKKIIPLFFLAVLIMSACKKDLSSMDVNKIEGISVDTTGMGILSVFQFDHLVVKPKITTGLKDADLSYEWRINLIPGDTASKVLATTRDLDVEINSIPNITGITTYYQLVYQATDKSSGLKYITVWKLIVRNSIGEGLVIAETTADGISTDLSHIMSPLVTRDYTGESIKHNIYSTINGSVIPGLVKQMRNNPEIQSLFGITDNSIFKINTIDYSLAGTNDDLFFSHSGAFKPQTLGGLTQGDLYVENGKLTANYIAVSKKFGLPFDSPYHIPDQIAVNGIQGTNAYLSFYDETNGVFVYQSSILSFGDREMHPIPSITGQAFNPGNLPNKINVAAGLGVNYDFLHLLKDKTTGKIALYVLSAAGLDDVNYVTLPPAPKAVYDLSNAPGINEATKFVLYDDQKVMYYATPTKIYAMLYSTVTPTFEERYTVPAGEQITTLQIYQQSDYPYSYDPYISTNNKQLIMSTYGTEGKVYILPLKNIGVGNIDLPNVKTYGGFGKITAIASQR